MKTYILGFCFVLASVSANAQITKQFSFSANDVKISQSGNYDVVRLDGTTPLFGGDYAGEPQLPVYYFKVLLPAGVKAASVGISVGQEIQIAGNFNIFPDNHHLHPKTKNLKNLTFKPDKFDLNRLIL